MFKKTLATALLVCSIPALASASWFLKTQATSAGGTLDSRNLTGQTVLDGPKFASYTSAKTSFSVKVTANTGYSLSSLLVNGVQQVFPTSGLPNPFTVILGGSATDKSVVATFLPQMESVTATNAYGTVSPSSVGGISYNYKLAAPLTFTFMPAPGYKITAINGIPADEGTLKVAKSIPA
ncbi:MAG TPA: hypothetical protein VJ550_01940, partial [Geomonas sp.]|nr:hypothetical protein [Geomonas sp.]